MAGKGNAYNVADKLSELIDAIKDCSGEAEENNTQLSTNDQLRNLFPSIAPHNRTGNNDINTSSKSSNATSSKSSNATCSSAGFGKHNASGIENFLKGKRSSTSRSSNRKKAKSSKSTSTVTAILKDIFFLVDHTGQVPKFERRSKLVEEGFVKSAVRFTSDMDERAIFSTIREKFLEKFDGDVPPFKILKAYGTKLVAPNLDGEWNYKVLKHQCGNGPIYVCPDTIRVSSDSEEEPCDISATKRESKVTTQQNSKPHSFSATATTSRRGNLEPEINYSPSQVLPRTGYLKVTCPICRLKVSSLEIEIHADTCAEKAAASNEYANLIWDVFPQDISEPDDDELFNYHESSLELESADTCILEGDIKKLRSVIKEDVSKLTIVDETKGICHLNIRRRQAWKDYVAFSKKPWNKNKVSYPVSVTFLGEAAVDTGGPKREFFSGKFHA